MPLAWLKLSIDALCSEWSGLDANGQAIVTNQRDVGVAHGLLRGLSRRETEAYVQFHPIDRPWAWRYSAL